MEEKRVPLHWRMKRKRHRKIARLQDMVVEVLYETLPRSVLHGGTAIWRCYSGNRFSGDIDAYLEKDIKRIEMFFEKLKRLGFKIVKKRIKENSLYSVVKFNETEIRFEALFKRVSGVIKEYETYEGGLMNVYTLTPEVIIDEKTDTYLKRRKIRDLYDIFFLLRDVKDVEKVREKLKELLKKFKDPIDEKELKALILFGVVPTKAEILEYIQRWVR